VGFSIKTHYTAVDKLYVFTYTPTIQIRSRHTSKRGNKPGRLDILHLVKQRAMRNRGNCGMQRGGRHLKGFATYGDIDRTNWKKTYT